MREGERAAVRSSYVTQAAILAGAGILSRVLGFALRVPMTNAIGDFGNGVYSDSYVIYNLIFVMSSAGIPSAISKMVSERLALGKKVEAYRIFEAALKFAVIIGLAGAFILAAGAGLFAYLIKDKYAYYSLLALSPTVLVVAIMSVFRGYFQGMNTTKPTAISQIVEQTFNITFSIVLMFAFMKIAAPQSSKYIADVTKAPAAFGAAGGQLGTLVGSLAGLATIVMIYYIAKPAIHPGPAVYSRYLRRESVFSEMIKVTIPVIAGTAVFSFSNLIDTIMLKSRMMTAGIAENDAITKYGMYSLKFVAITTLPVSIAAALAAAITPSIAHSAALGDKKEVKGKIDSVIRITMLISVPAAVGLAVLARPIVGLFFPNAPDGWQLLAVGSTAVIFLALNSITSGILIGIGKIYIPVVAAFSGVVVKIILNYILCAIPSVNIYGAVISSIACYIVASVVNMRMIIKITKTKPDFKSALLKPVFAALGMGLSCYVFYYLFFYITGRNSVSAIIGVLIGIAAYCFFMALSNGFLRSDLQMMPMGNRFIRYLERRGMM